MFKTIFARLFATSLTSILSNLEGLVVQLDTHSTSIRAKADAAEAQAKATMEAAVAKGDAAVDAAHAKFAKAVDKAIALHTRAEDEADGLSFKADMHRYEADKADRVAAKVRALVA